MDPQGHNQPPPLMMVGGGPYGSGPYQSNSSTTGSGQPAQMAQHQLAYQHIHQQQQHQLQQQLQSFWAGQHQETERATDFKNHSLPLARIKKIMKADEDVRMISAEAPVVFARACEMFVLELTLRAWSHTEENKRRTLQRNDIAAAITRTDIFDFLVDIVPREDLKDEALAAAAATSSSSSVMAPAPRGGGMVGPAETMPYCYPGMPGQHPGMMMGGGGNNKVMMDPGMYAPAQMSYMAQQMWQQQPPPPADQQQSPPER